MHQSTWTTVHTSEMLRVLYAFASNLWWCSAFLFFDSIITYIVLKVDKNRKAAKQSFVVVIAPLMDKSQVFECTGAISRQRPNNNTSVGNTLTSNSWYPQLFRDHIFYRTTCSILFCHADALTCCLAEQSFPEGTTLGRPKKKTRIYTGTNMEVDGTPCL